MRSHSEALRLTIYIGEDDSWNHKPLYREIVRLAQRAGLAGATVLRGVEGFGAHSVVHTTRLLSMAEDLPIAIIIIDDEDRIRDFLPQMDEMLTEGLIVLDPVEVVRYAPRPSAPAT